MRLNWGASRVNLAVEGVRSGRSPVLCAFFLHCFEVFGPPSSVDEDRLAKGKSLLLEECGSKSDR